MRNLLPLALVLFLSSLSPVRAQEHGAQAHDPSGGHPPAAKDAGRTGQSKADHGPAKPIAAEAKSGSAHSSKVAAAAEEHASSPASTGPRHASSQELDAVLERISKKIAARAPRAASNQAPKRAAGPAAQSQAPRREAPASVLRIELEWRPAVVWPTDLKPAPAADGDRRIGVAWPSSFN